MSSLSKLTDTIVNIESSNEVVESVTKKVTNSFGNLVRKLLTLSTSAFNWAIIASVGYVAYRAYLNKSNQIDSTLTGSSSENEFNCRELQKLRRTSQEIHEIEKRLNEFDLSHETLTQIMDILECEMEKGLDMHRNGEADVKMLPTYVCELPSGKETGDILALDLGGSNFRVLLIRLRGNEKPIMINKVFILSESIIRGSGERLFAHIANCLYLFMKNESLDLKKTYSLGFTFSFPCRQSELSNGVLLRWTKGYSCADVVGRDVVSLLQNAIDSRNDIQVKVCIMINDTVGTLMSTAFYDKKTAVGLILGTGTNACYFEKLERIQTLNLATRSKLVDKQEMVVNTEWGAFGENNNIDFIRSRYDDEIDKTSINVGKQIFEKMVSGMYLGEIVRLVILDLIDNGLLFTDAMKKNTYRNALFTKGSFYTKYLHEIESDCTLSTTKRILKEIAGIDKPFDDDCCVVRSICHIVTKRAARLTAAGLAVILKRIQKNDVTIAVDGSLFRYHPNFQKTLEKTLKKLIDPSIHFQIVLSTDGSGRGAAVVASIVSNSNTQNDY